MLGLQYDAHLYIPQGPVCFLCAGTDGTAMMTDRIDMSQSHVGQPFEFGVLQGLWHLNTGHRRGLSS